MPSGSLSPCVCFFVGFFFVFHLAGRVFAWMWVCSFPLPSPQLRMGAVTDVCALPAFSASSSGAVRVNKEQIKRRSCFIVLQV